MLKHKIKCDVINIVLKSNTCVYKETQLALVQSHTYPRQIIICDRISVELNCQKNFISQVHDLGLNSINFLQTPAYIRKHN